MEEKKDAKVEIDGVSPNVAGDKSEKVNMGPGGIHLADGDSQVDISWSGIRIKVRIQ